MNSLCDFGKRGQTKSYSKYLKKLFSQKGFSEALSAAALLCNCFSVFFFKKNLLVDLNKTELL